VKHKEDCNFTMFLRANYTLVPRSDSVATRLLEDSSSGLIVPDKSGLRSNFFRLKGKVPHPSIPRFFLARKRETPALVSLREKTCSGSPSLISDLVAMFLEERALLFFLASHSLSWKFGETGC